MAELLKNHFFTSQSVNDMTEVIQKFYPEFDTKKFTKLVFDSSFKTLELKAKMRHTTLCLKKTLPGSYEQALKILKDSAPYVKGFESMTLPDFVELYGMDYWDLSLQALRHFTKFSSSEFAIRPYIIKDPEKAMKFMLSCAEDTTKNVRRFASEGCRPRLPWAMALPVFKKDPKLITPVLDKLKNDESEFVRRSVANNLNDISKDNPDIVLDICTKWFGKTENTDKIIKHACRSLLKAGNKNALLLFGFADPINIKVGNLKLNKEKIKIGEDLFYSFELNVSGNKTNKVRSEYRMDFVKASGKLSGKIFQILQKNYNPGKHLISRKHSFMDHSTRKHYPGIHKITIIINGVELAFAVFEVT